jgi:hypothetical protein
MQMNRPHDDGGGAVENQLAALERLEVFRVSVLDHARAAEAPWRKMAELRGKGKKPRAAPEKVDASLLGFQGWDPLAAMVQIGWACLRKGVMGKLEKEPGTTSRLPRPLSRDRKLADPVDRAADLGSRARSYLQANCAHCHVEAGGGNSAFDVHVATPTERMKLVGVKPVHDAFGIAEALLVAPGAPERSVLYARLERRGPGQMPPLATSLADGAALDLFGDWIRSLR